MFIATFQKTDSSKFNADKNNNKPYIGKVLAGTSTGSIINGTMFQRDGLIENKAYLCNNETEVYNGKDIVHTRVISEVSLLELQPLMSQLGEPRLGRDTTE